MMMRAMAGGTSRAGTSQSSTRGAPPTQSSSSSNSGVPITREQDEVVQIEGEAIEGEKKFSLLLSFHFTIFSR